MRREATARELRLEEKTMSKTQTIRDVLADGKRLTLDEILVACEKAGEQIFNRKKTYDLIGFMHRSGQVKQSGGGHSRKYWLSNGKAIPSKHRGRAKARVNEHIHEAPPQNGSASALALSLVGHTLGMLKTEINRAEGNTELCAAFIAHEQAIQLARTLNH
jgi:uncharacterized NAD(P)/FAD-binding protein YdhS